MRKLYFKVIYLLFMLFFVSGLQAQSRLYIHAKDGTKTSYPLNEIRKLTFPLRTIALYGNDGSTQAFPFIELRQVRFTEFVSGNNSLDLAESNSLSVFPNPVSSELNLRFLSGSGGTVEIRILDVHGKTVSIKKEHTLQGINQVNLQLSDLPKGLYVCRVRHGKSTETRKFLKN